MTLQIKIRWRKLKTCLFGSTKWFWARISAQFAEYGKLKGPVKINTWEECNKYDLTTIRCFWLANYID
jgi:hypothetical protein